MPIFLFIFLTHLLFSVCWLGSLFSEIEENHKNIFWCLSYGSCFASSVSVCACVLVSLRYTPTSSPQAPTATKTSKEKNNKNPWSRFFLVFSFVSYKAVGWWKGLDWHWETDRQGGLPMTAWDFTSRARRDLYDTKAVFFVFFKTDNRSALLPGRREPIIAGD